MEFLCSFRFYLRVYDFFPRSRTEESMKSSKWKKNKNKIVEFQNTVFYPKKLNCNCTLNIFLISFIELIIVPPTFCLLYLFFHWIHSSIKVMNNVLWGLCLAYSPGYIFNSTRNWNQQTGLNISLETKCSQKCISLKHYVVISLFHYNTLHKWYSTM